MRKHRVISSVGYSWVRWLLGCVCIAIVPDVVAQSFEEHAQRMNERFEAFRQEKQQEFTAFTARQNEEFAAFVEQQWQLFENCRLQRPSQSTPKPDRVPVASDTQADAAPVDSEKVSCSPAHSSATAGTADTYVVRTVVSSSGTKEVAVAKPQPVAGNVSGNTVNVVFYGQSLPLPFSSKLNLHTAGSREADCAAYFRAFALCSSESHALWQAVEKQATVFGLNEWGRFCMVRSVAETLFKTTDDRVLFCFCMLRNEGGYKVKLARGCDSGNLTLLLALDNRKDVFSYSYFTMEDAGQQVKYYSVYGGGKAKECVYTYTFQEQDGRLREMGLDFTRTLTIGKCDKTRMLRSAKYAVEISLPYNSANLAYLDDVPMTVFPVYFQAPMPPEAQQALQTWTDGLKREHTQVELVSVLLDFVQTAFQYKTDENQFGYEKYFYPEEVVGYPYSDCEDRSALFAWLVTTFAGARVIGLQYEGHVATAVSFDDDTALSGDYFSYGGRKYYMCDPTFCNAPIGMTMPVYKGKTPKVIKLKAPVL